MKTFLVLAVWGIIVPHLVFLRQLMNKAGCALDWYYLCEHELIQEMIIFLILVPLLLVDQMHYFYYSCILGILCLIFNLSVITYFAIIRIENSPSVVRTDFIPTEIYFHKLYTVFGGVVWAFESVTSIFHIRADMKKPKEFRNIMKYIFFMTTILYLVFA